MSSPTIFCATCGAENPLTRTQCFACGNPPLVAAPARRVLLHQRYHLLNLIDEGGFGAVYRAEDTQLGNRVVAIKKMSQDGLTTAQEKQGAAASFRREANLLAGLSHPNLPRIFEQFQEDQNWYLVMEFIEGGTLETRWEKAPGNCLPLAETLQIGLQLTRVLDYLHTRQQPIIFRDLKPSNIMLTSDGHLYLIDFGIARVFKPGQAQDTTKFGSPGYAAPEQYGKTQTTAQSDIYSLGATLHQLLSGYDPRNNTPLPWDFKPLKPPVPSELSQLITHMLKVRMDERPLSMALVQHELQHIADAFAAGQTRTGLVSIPPSPAPLAQKPPIISSPAPVNPNPGHPPNPALPPALQPPAIPVTSRAKPARRVSRRAVLIGGGALVVTVAGGGIWLTRASSSPNLPYTYNGHYNAVKYIAWSSKSKRIVSGSANGSMQAWDAPNGDNVLNYNHLSGENGVALSPDGKHIAAASYTLAVCDASDGGNVITYDQGTVYSIAWSPDNMYMASGSDTGIQVWVAPNGGLAGLFSSGQYYFVNTVAWSPDSKRIAFNSSNTVYVYASPNGGIVYAYGGHSYQVNTVAWSPGAKRIASSSNDGTVQVWNASDGGNVYTYRGHSDTVNAVAWSPGGKRIASGSGDKTVQVWDATNGGNIFTYRGHSDTVNVVAWSPDGKYIASGSDDKTVQVWKAP